MSDSTHDAEWEVTPEHVAQLRQDGKALLLLDVRTDREVATAAIDGARVIEMQELPARIDEIEEHAKEKVVVFCHGGVRSLRVTEFLRDRGFTDAWSMAGGIDAWSKRVDPSVPTY